jgi:hypothetical protein
MGEKDADVPYNSELIARTQAAAATSIAAVSAADLFRRGPLARAILAAIILAVSLPAFAIVAPGAFRTWMSRIALSPDPWPRRVHLEVVGFPADSAGSRRHKLAVDDDFEFFVRAATENFVVPEDVEIRFRLADGRRGRDTLTRVGQPVPGPDGYQLFRYEFKHVAADMTFDIVGGDERVRNLKLQIVDRPELIGMEVQCDYPNYLGQSSRSLPITGGMRIPEGTKLTIRAHSTKPLTEVRIHTAHDAHNFVLPQLTDEPRAIEWHYGTLSADDVLTIQAIDSDGVTCREPYRISLSSVTDEVPQVAVRLAGVGTAITPDAVIPLAGKISDDYGLERIWFTYQIGNGHIYERPFSKQPGGAQSVTDIDRFDLRATSDAPSAPAPRLKAGETFRVTVHASDRFNLSPAPHAGASQEFAFDVVTVAQLLAQLERRELELRQRFEAIHAKTTDTRNLLSRVDEKVQATDAASDDATSAPPGSATQPSGEAADPSASERSLTRRRLRIAGALQNITQSSHEVVGVAEAFQEMYDEIENNRVDNPDLKSRLRDQIAMPLMRLGEKRLPELESQLQLIQDRVADGQAETPGLAETVKLADQILVEMQQVLDRMLELESYNEVVALLRGIIHDQQELNEKTKERQNDKLKGLLDN